MNLLVELIEKKMGEKFLDPHYVRTALTHRSFMNENNHLGGEDNERLEFLGDSVLGLIVSHELMRKFPNEKEGSLSKYRSSLVNEKVLSKLALEISMNEHVRLGKGEDKNAGRKKKSILADAFEALIAAVFLSNGFDATKTFVLSLMEPWINSVQNYSLVLDYKSQLQEYTLKLFKVIPRYNLIKQVGPDHFKTFETQVVINEKVYGMGKGKSKKDSEQKAAKQALEALKESESAHV
ncbi:MAG: ribonuclease III [Deltaproteobacteria bacterium]|nr:ribonuclease III [Deltaproteobacteria bacterium]